MLRLEHEFWASCADCDFIEVETSAGAAEEAAKAHLLTAFDHMVHIEAKTVVFNGCDECGSPVKFCEENEVVPFKPGSVN